MLIAPLPSQQGSIAILAAAFISLAVILAASIDIGFLFFQKRELQKIADMSALAGAQELARIRAIPNSNCATVFSTATNSARIAHNFVGTLNASCGQWDPVVISAEPHFLEYAGGNTPLNRPAPNAVRVHISRSFGSFLGVWAEQTVSANAIATVDAPTAVFSVGSNLLKVTGGGGVTNLLSALGANITGAGLVSYNGLANIDIQTGALLKALGFQIPLNADVATIKQALMLNVSCPSGVCTLEKILGAISIVGGQQNLVSALGMQSQQLTLPIRMISDATGRGLFALIDTADGQSALTADLNAQNLLVSAIGVANSHNFVSLPLSATLPGVIGSVVNVGIVEPPTIGIGGIGTTATTAQVRLATHIQTNALTANLAKIDLPLQIDVVNGQGTITDMCRQRDASGNFTATIAVTAPLLSMCVGNINPATAFEANGTCGPTNVLNVLGGALSVTSGFSLNALSTSGSVVLSKGQTATVGSNNLQVGTAVKNLLQAALATLLGQTLAQGQGTVTNSTLAAGLLSASGNVLATSVNELNNSLSSLKTFVNGLSPDVKALLNGSLSSGVNNLLNSVGGLLTGLLTSVGNLLNHLVGNVLCALSPHGYNQCVVENQLSGNQTSGGNTVSNVLLSILGLIEKVLEPLLNTLGNEIASMLNNLLGAQIGPVDVTLIDLNCGGGENVKLVF